MSGSGQSSRQSGSVVTYILIVIFLTGILVVSMSQGSKKSADTVQIEKQASFLMSDIKAIHSAVSECVQSYSKAVDVNGDSVIDAADNPNPPFPLYAGTPLASGGTGTALGNVKCPGAPASQQSLFTGTSDVRFNMISDTANYTVTYISDAVEGVYLRITRSSSDPLWDETISRLDSKISACSAAIDTTTPVVCANKCLNYWIVRKSVCP